MGPVQQVCGVMQQVKMPVVQAAGFRLALLLLASTVASWLASGPAQAEKIKNETAVFAALDKVTGRISHLEIPIDQTVEFGALKVTPRVCNTRPPTEAPDTASFVEVDEIKLTGEEQRIFTGWMFAESPGLHAVEHPVFDVWLTSCKTASAPAPSDSNANAPSPDATEATEAPAEEAPPAAAEAPPPPEPAAPAGEEILPWATPPGNAASRAR